MARKSPFPLVVAATITLSALTVALASEEAAPAPPAGTPTKKVRMKQLAPPVPGVPTANSGLPAFDAGQRLTALTARLKLSPAQQTKMKPILEDTEKQVKDAWGAGGKTAAHEKVKGILEASDVRIRAILDGTQKDEWEKMKERTANRTYFKATTLE